MSKNRLVDSRKENPMRLHQLWLALGALLGSGSVLALAPDSYDMPNGNTGSFAYHDDSYSGLGCLSCDGAALSGGTGDLTDGVIATDNWFVTEAPAGAGPYVGWFLVTPRITFRWDTPVNITSVTFHFDDTDGVGGVSAPASLDIDGNSFTVADPAGSAPFSFTAAVSFSGTDLTVDIFRRTEWVFLSEVEFNATPVPEPGTTALMLAGLAALGAAARSRRAP
jgi:hypothetical protein